MEEQIQIIQLCTTAIITTLIELKEIDILIAENNILTARRKLTSLSREMAKHSEKLIKTVDERLDKRTKDE